MSSLFDQADKVLKFLVHFFHENERIANLFEFLFVFGVRIILCFFLKSFNEFLVFIQHLMDSDFG
jgi:hypothetical protein